MFSIIDFEGPALKGKNKPASGGALSSGTSSNAYPKKTFVVTYGDEGNDNDAPEAFYNFPTNHIIDSTNAPFVYVTESIDLAGYMVLDTACQRSCTGTRWMETQPKILQNHGLSGHHVPCEEHFQFGAGACQISKERCYVPVAFTGQETQGVLLGISIVEDVSIPFLASRVLMQELGCIIDLHQGILCLSALGATAPLVHKHFHLVACIVSFPPRAAQMSCWQELQRQSSWKKPHPEVVLHHEAAFSLTGRRSILNPVNVDQSDQAAAAMVGQLANLPPPPDDARVQHPQDDEETREVGSSPTSLAEQLGHGRLEGGNGWRSKSQKLHQRLAPIRSSRGTAMLTASTRGARGAIKSSGGSQNKRLGFCSHQSPPARRRCHCHPRKRSFAQRI